MANDPDSYSNPMGPFCITPTHGKKDIIELLGGMIVTLRNHHEVHEGEFYETGHTFIDVADTATVYLRVKTTTKQLHFGTSVDAEGKAYAFIYEDTTYTADGTVVAIHNNNRASSNVAVSEIFHTPTVDVLGMLITPENGILVPGGLGPQSVGGSVKADEEIVGKTASNYLIAVQNVSGQPKDITIQVGGYEESTLLT